MNRGREILFHCPNAAIWSIPLPNAAPFCTASRSSNEGIEPCLAVMKLRTRLCRKQSIGD